MYGLRFEVLGTSICNLLIGVRILALQPPFVRMASREAIINAQPIIVD